jgi:Superoxide dismutase
MAFELPALPYPKDAFGDVFSAETFDFHHGKHHNAYVVKANELVAGNPDFQGKSLLELIALTAKSGPQGLFNQVGQIWNHSFYWLGLSPETKTPSGKLADMIDASFGSFDDLVKKLTAESVGHFGSGWSALILKDGKIEIATYHDADTPVAHGDVPLLILDVWEHAYYIDYRNARPAYAEKVLREAIDWDFVAKNLDGEGASRADQPA